jgi:hypothetical protein
MEADLTNKLPAGREVCAAVPVFAWFLGPVRWVVQANPGLSEVDLHTHSLAFKEYGFYFVVGVGVFNVLYLGSPHLWQMCLRLHMQVRQRCMVWNDSTKAR